MTGFPEMLDGRVKTIHPRIAGGDPGDPRQSRAHAVARGTRNSANRDGGRELYQFEKIAAKPGVTREELIENIDIGGPTMIRAAAKNYQDVAVVVSPDQYDATLDGVEERRRSERRYTLAVWRRKPSCTRRPTIGRFQHVWRQVDAPATAMLPGRLDISAPAAAVLRYGENPHQQAALYPRSRSGIAGAEQLHGKELSYNNLVDLDAAWQLDPGIRGTAAAIIKHTNPCGCAEQSDAGGRPTQGARSGSGSAFGGVLAFNREAG